MIVVTSTYRLEWPVDRFVIEAGENRLGSIPAFAKSVVQAHQRAGFLSIEEIDEPGASSVSAMQPDDAASPLPEGASMRDGKPVHDLVHREPRKRRSKS